MATFYVSEKINELKADIMEALTSSDYTGKFLAINRVAESISDIEDRLYDIEKLEEDKEQYKSLLSAERATRNLNDN